MKAYDAPAIAAEDLVEQTSLACSGTVIAEEFQNGAYGPAIGLACDFDRSKGEAFMDPAECTELLRAVEDVIALS